MRPAQKSNRSRGRGNRKGGGGGNNMNRVYDSAGPEGKVRGTPQQIIEKYLTLARDAQTSGDRVAAENFLQHAEHYQRILIQATAAQEQARQSQEAAAEARAAQSDDSGQQQQAPQQQAPQQQNNPQPEAAAEPDIGGMAMIDSGPSESTLVVDADEGTKSQPRRNGDGRRRRQKPADAEETPAAAETPQQPPAQAEG